MAFEIVNGTLKKYEGSGEHVVIPREVTEIGDYAFYGASQLKSLRIPDTVREMGDNIFYDCESLEEVILPDSLSYIGSAMFSRCASLKRVVFPDTLTWLPRITFFQCESLVSVHLPSSLERIGRACFEPCHSLEEIILPGNLKTLDENVFDDCTALKKVCLPETLETIGDNVFFNCCSLEELILPSSLKSIGKGAFETRGKLKLTVPDSIAIHSKMLDNNWNMYWNFGVNRRYNGKNEDNYQLYDSRIANVNLKEWKPSARIILAVNYLETFDREIDFYHAWIRENTQELLETLVSQRRYRALNKAVELDLVSPDDLLPYLGRISDRDEKAKLLAMNKEKRQASDLFDTDLDDLF
ncbi:MAG: leucine-rich repeat domain-containing protein [Erysipelotrichaceae bacterium]|nr:leucine-rich repeat domain-containing protein [Erysipelotrichaceae bacterium]